MGSSVVSYDAMPFLILIACLSILSVSSENVVRKPKLFFVSTSATTSTISTSSVCYISTDKAPVACVGRKRRTITFDNKPAFGSSVEPSAPEVEASNKAKLDGERDGRFLLYWITTTSISTSTSYTTTITISSVGCTPSGVTLCNG